MSSRGWCSRSFSFSMPALDITVFQRANIGTEIQPPLSPLLSGFQSASYLVKDGASACLLYRRPIWRATEAITVMYGEGKTELIINDWEIYSPRSGTLFITLRSSPAAEHIAAASERFLNVNLIHSCFP